MGSPKSEAFWGRGGTRKRAKFSPYGGNEAKRTLFRRRPLSANEHCSFWREYSMVTNPKRLLALLLVNAHLFEITHYQKGLFSGKIKKGKALPFSKINRSGYE